MKVAVCRNVLMGGGAWSPPIFSEMQESWSKVDHAARKWSHDYLQLFSFFSNNNWSNGHNTRLNEKGRGIYLCLLALQSKI